MFDYHRAQANPGSRPVIYFAFMREMIDPSPSPGFPFVWSLDETSLQDIQDSKVPLQSEDRKLPFERALHAHPFSFFTLFCCQRSKDLRPFQTSARPVTQSLDF